MNRKLLNCNNTYFHLLAEIFPPYIIALTIFPSLAGVFINPDAVDPGEILVNLVWIPLFTIPYAITRKKIFYFLIVFFCFVNGFVNLSHWLFVKGPLSASSLFVIFSTNITESLGFWSLKKSYLLLLLTPYVLFLILALQYSSKISASRYRVSILTSVVFLYLIFIADNVVHKQLIRKGVPVLIKATVSYYKEVKAFKVLKATNDYRLFKLKASCQPTLNKQVFVLILGESANRNHMSLYGYRRPTTPRLQHRKDINVYNDIVSAYSLTLYSVCFSLTESNLENKKDFAESIGLIDVYKAAGFKTYWISNQSPIGMWDNLITLFAQTSDVAEFVNLSASSSFESTYTASYDENLFKPFLKVLEDSSPRKFIVLHLMGSHSSYNARYPSKFNIFRDNRTKAANTIARYDNSIFYNDFIVDSMLNILTAYSVKNRAISASVYVSDHGENVYDESDYAGHDWSGKMTRHHVEIPFIVWLSPLYKNTYIKKTETIKANYNKPFVTDDLFHAMIDLSNVNTSSFEKQRSVFNKSFNDKRVRVLADGVNYDKK